MTLPRSPAMHVALLLAVAALGLGAESPADLQFDYADGLYRDGLHKLAIAELTKFLKLYPKDPRASLVRFELGDCHYLTGDYKAALPHLEAAAKDLGLSARPLALYRAGDCRYRLGDTKGAIAPLRQFLAAKLVSPEHRRFVVHARYTLACAEFAQKNFVEALHLFNQVLVDTSPENTYKPYVLLPIGDCQSALGKPEQALASYRQLEKFLVAALRQKPKTPEAKPRKELLERVRAKIAALLLTAKKYDETLAVLGLLSTEGPYAAQVLYGRAQALFFLGRYREALVPALDYLKRFPKGEFVPSALFFAGQSSYETGQFAEAESHFARLLSLDSAKKFPAREAAAFGRVAAAYRQGQAHAEAAVAAADAFLKEFPKSAHGGDVAFFRAEANFWLKRYEPAAADYRRVPLANPQAERAAYQVAVCLDSLGRHREAAEAYDAYLTRYPNGANHRAALERSARLWGQLKDYTKTAERCGQFVERYAKADPKTAAEFLYRKGACEFETGRYDQMFQTFQRYFKDFKEGSHKGDVLYFLAWYYGEHKKQYEAAIPLYELCGNMPGRYALRARVLLAHTYHRLGKQRLAEKKQDEANALFGKAAEAFLALIREHPELLSGPNEYLWTAATFRELGRKAEAIAAYEALIKRFPKQATPEVIYTLGDLYLNPPEPNYARAEACFRDFLERFPDHKYVIWAKFGLAETLKGSGKTKEAWELYQQVEQLAPHVLDNPSVRDGLVLRAQLQMGRMAFEDKNWEFARRYLLRIGYLAGGQEGAEALYKAGVASLQLKMRKPAATVWARLLRLYPKSSWAARLRKEAPQLGFRIAPDGKSIEPLANEKS